MSARRIGAGALVSILVAACANLEPPRDSSVNDGPVCSEGSTRCAGSSYEACQSGRYVTLKQCQAPQVCVESLKGCADCNPNLDRVCRGDDLHVCQPTGSLGAKVKTCPAGACLSGACTDPCSAAEEKRSYLGCSYWPTVTMNSVLSDDFSFVVAVANPNSTEVTVTVERAGTSVRTATVPANGLTTISLPWIKALKQSSLLGSVLVTDGAYHLISSLPVAAYQFNPFDFKLATDCPSDPEPRPPDGICHSFSNDASLLLPVQALGKSYMVLARPSATAWVFGADWSRFPGFFAVVATRPGTTKVDVTFSADTMSGSWGLQAYKKGEKASFDLEQGAVLQILSALPTCTPVKTDSTGTGFCDLSATTDLTGTEISASENVAVFAGHNCAFVPFDKWACDHLEEQLYPISSLGKKYVGAHTLSSGADPSVYRILSVADQNTITFNPPVRESVTLDRGKFVEFETNQDFVASGSGPFLMAQFMVGASYAKPPQGTAVPNDPSMSLAVPVEQFRTDYRFIAPASYDQSYVNIIAPELATVKLDGSTVPGSEFKLIGTVDPSGWVVAKLKIGGGIHVVESTQPAGISVYGVGAYTSYMYPGGLDLKELLK